MDAYLFDQSGALVKLSRQGIKERDRELKTRLPAGRFTFPAQGNYRFYVKVRSPMQISLSLYLVDDMDYLARAAGESNFYFAYYGTVIGLILYNFSIFFVMRSRDFIYYIFFGISMLLNAYIQGGFGEYSPWRIPLLDSIDDTYRVLFLPCISSLLFTLSFLQIRQRSRPLFRIMVGLVALASASQVLAWFLPHPDILGLTSYFDMGSIICVFVGSTLAIRAGDRIARIFLCAWGILAISVAIWLLGNFGFVEKTFFIAMSPLAGNMAEMLLMSIALAMRIREIRSKKLLAERQVIEQENLQTLLRMVCHDISNPLAIIKSAAYISKRLEPSDQSHMPRVERAAKSIEDIISQVRKYEAARSGKLEIALTPCSLRSAFEEVGFYFATRAEEKLIRLECHIPQDIDDLHVLGDPSTLSHEILNNLVSNALKFTAQGGSVRLSASAGPDHVYIFVEDDGIGIPEELRSEIFDLSRPTNREGTAAESGSGFGLPIVKTFVELFGGEISVSSRVADSEQEKSHDRKDHGTTITIKLKRALNS